jgi:hypothetical protein
MTTMKLHRRKTRTYPRLVIGLVGLFAGVAGIVNTTVNPWRVTPVPWQAESLDPYRGEADRLRTRKAGILRSGDWGVALVGSSRVANGFDPALPQWRRNDVANLGCSAGFLQEATAIGSYFVRHEPAELLLFGVDPGDLTSSVDTRPMFDFESSPFSPNANLDTELRYIFGLSTLDSSLETLQHARRKQTGEFDPLGMRRVPKRHKGSQVNFIAQTITRKIELETADAASPDRPFNDVKLRKLREMLDEARRKPCRVIVFFQANHALMHAEAGHIGTSVIPFEKERRALVTMIAASNAAIPGAPPIELWDFCNYHPLSCEPIPLDNPKEGRMKDWADLGHFTPEVGTQMLALMMGWPLPKPEWADIGRKLDAANLDAYLTEVATGYQRYLTRDGSRDLEWKEKLKAGAGD